MNAKPLKSWGQEAYENAKWAEQHERDMIGRAMGNFSVNESDMKSDQKRATDFNITKSGEMRVACRVRRFTSTKDKYRDLTIRTWLKSGAKTELDKLHHVHRYAYGWEGQYGELREFVWLNVPAICVAIKKGIFDVSSDRWRINKGGKTAFVTIPIHKLQDTPDCLIGGLEMGPVSFRWRSSNDWIKHQLDNPTDSA